MKVERLSIKSFRGINNLTLEFPPSESIVFIGANGVGKSSILDCLAILLSWLPARLQNPQTSGQFFTEEDIKNGAKETQNEIIIRINNRDQPVKWSRIRTRTGRSKETRSDLVQLTQLVGEIHESLDENFDVALPVIAYYPTNRAVLDIPLRIRKKHLFEPMATYEEALTGGSINFRRFFEWFRQREDLENEQRLWGESIDYRDRQLEAVRQAISGILGDIQDLRIQRSPLRMTLTKQGQELSVSQLSDGEKC